MVKKFERAMAKLAVLGHNPNLLVDCSEVIPIPSTPKAQVAVFPAGKTNQDVVGAVSGWCPLGETRSDASAVRCHALPDPLDCPWSRHQHLPRVGVRCI